MSTWEITKPHPRVLAFILDRLGPDLDAAAEVTYADMMEASGLSLLSTKRHVSYLGRAGYVETIHYTGDDGIVRRVRRRGPRLRPGRDHRSDELTGTPPPAPDDPAAERRYCLRVLAEGRRLHLWPVLAAVLDRIDADGECRATIAELADATGKTPAAVNDYLCLLYRVRLLGMLGHRGDDLAFCWSRRRGEALRSLPDETLPERDAGRVWAALVGKRDAYPAGRLALTLLADMNGPGGTTAANSLALAALTGMSRQTVRNRLRVLYAVGIIEDRPGSTRPRPIRGRGPALDDRIHPADPDGSRSDDRSTVTVDTPDPAALDRRKWPHHRGPLLEAWSTDR